MRCAMLLGLLCWLGCGGGGGSTAVCDRLGSAATHLKDVLAKCPGSGDAAITTFNASVCSMNLSKCSGSEQATLDLLAQCDQQIAACGSAADRQTAQAAVEACAARVNGLSQDCLRAISG
ncbi:MAG: hypothetical protein K1X89_05800 [Myxococcaceae bacterium]|nr:hypothetical protein [Myxococcaceae bacterium]